MTILETRNLNKTFITRRSGRRRTVHAVKDVNLTITEGAITGLVGESGCGKSTLTRLILGLERPDSGAILYRGRDITRLSRRARRELNTKIQIVFQDPDGSFNPKKTMEWSLSEGLHNLGVDTSESRRRILELTERVSLSPEELKKYPGQLSGGQKQRLSIVRALSMGAEMLILDEPVSSLDVSIQAQIINLLASLKKELDLSLLFISHDLGLVGYFCDHIHVMYRGEIIESAAADQMLSAPEKKYTGELFAAAPRLDVDS